MRKVGILFALASALYGQTVKITPANPSVGQGLTVQFTAQVTGLANAAITWYVAGVAGGNSTSGKISATGLYTAPASLPGQNPVTIAAASVTSTSIKATTYVSILATGPTIASVSPNPLPAGTYNVTIGGSGIQPGAVVMNGAVQLTTIQVTPPTSVTANGWQGPASSATFYVRNPGSTPSNSLTVPVTGGTTSPTYTLTVVNGTGSGNYAAGSVVDVSANAPPAGKAFTNWTGAAVANASVPATTLTMPAANTTVSANYYAPTYKLTVVSGTGSGNYPAGAPRRPPSPTP